MTYYPDYSATFLEAVYIYLFRVFFFYKTNEKLKKTINIFKYNNQRVEYFEVSNRRRWHLTLFYWFEEFFEKNIKYKIHLYYFYIILKIY